MGTYTSYPLLSALWVLCTCISNALSGGMVGKKETAALGAALAQALRTGANQRGQGHDVTAVAADLGRSGCGN